MLSSKAHQPLFVLKQHSSAVSTCAVDDQGVLVNFLLSGDVDGIVILWDLEVREALCSFHAVQMARLRGNLIPEKPTSPCSPGCGVLQVGFLSFVGSSVEGVEPSVVYFYSQCRDQQLYVWRTRMDSLGVGYTSEVCESETRNNSVELIHAIHVPQHGFCSVPSVFVSSGKFQLAVPHDCNGVVSLWDVCLPSETSTANEGLGVSCSRSFSAAGALVKCGTVMCISFRDSSRIAVAFESGHISLCSTRGEQLVIIRAFAETALGCVWSNNTLLVSSAEGRLQCYSTTESATGGCHPEGSSCVAGLSSTLKWETTLPKGLGCVALQRHLVVVGSWDHTLRLFDEGSGRVVSILTFHNATVNSIAMAPSRVAGSALFGYDMRHPRWCGVRAPYCGDERGIGGPEDSDVYLFASACGDYAVAVWRVDFKVLSVAAHRAP